MAAAFALIWLAAFSAFIGVSHRGGWIEVVLETQSPGLSQAQLYFDRGEGLNDVDRASAWVRTGYNTLRFPLPAGSISSVRFDPNRGDAPLFIHKISISPDRQEVRQGLALGSLEAENEVESIQAVEGGLLVQPVEGASAVRLWLQGSIPVVIPASPLHVPSLVTSATLLVLCFYLLWRFALRRQWSWQIIVPVGLLVVLVLCWTMAWASSRSIPTHPDEVSHLWGFQYHLAHLLPPAVDNPEIVRTMSIYGFSYLFELDVIYALAALIVGPFAGLFPDDLSVARMFNLGLLVLLACMATRSRLWALCISVCLLSPQIWYVFSYFNADALPFFLGLVAACVVADEESGLNRYLRGTGTLGAGVGLFVLAAGLLLISKRNYLPLVPVFGLWLAIRHLGLHWWKALMVMIGLAALGASVHLGSVPGWRSGTITALRVAAVLVVVGVMLMAAVPWWKRAELRAIFLRLLVAFSLVFAVAAPRVGLDVVLNGTPGKKSQTLEQIAEKYAGDGFKPSQLDQEIAYAGRALVLRGTSLREILFTPYHWLRISLISTYGVYGYMVAMPPPWLPWSLLLITLMITLIAAGSMISLDRKKAAPMLVVIVGGCGLVLLNSLLHSWVFDLQRQGRYLFPAFLLLALLLGSASSRLPNRLLAALVFVGFALSCVSFVTVALPALASG